MHGSLIEVFYDHGCPLCRKEIRFLKWLDRKHSRIQATNIDSPEFVPPDGFTLQMFMERIHGRLPSGEIIEGVDVFRHLYSAVGWGWLMSLTRMPVVSHILDGAYVVFANVRLYLRGSCRSGTCTLNSGNR